MSLVGIAEQGLTGDGNALEMLEIDYDLEFFHNS
jgi:hypothetical protein